MNLETLVPVIKQYNESLIKKNERIKEIESFLNENNFFLYIKFDIPDLGFLTWEKINRGYKLFFTDKGMNSKFLTDCKLDVRSRVIPHLDAFLDEIHKELTK